MDAKGIPLYAGPKRTSNSGIDPFSKALAMVVAYAVATVDNIGPVQRRPALKKYGEILRDPRSLAAFNGDLLDAPARFEGKRTKLQSINIHCMLYEVCFIRFKTGHGEGRPWKTGKKR